MLNINLIWLTLYFRSFFILILEFLSVNFLESESITFPNKWEMIPRLRNTLQTFLLNFYKNKIE